MTPIRSLASPSAGRLRLMLVASVLLLFSSIALMAGATYAWFTDSLTNRGNVIRAADSFGSRAPVLLVEEAPVVQGEPAPDPVVQGEPAPDPAVESGEAAPGEAEGDPEPPEPPDQGAVDQPLEGDVPADPVAPEHETGSEAGPDEGSPPQEVQRKARSAAGG